MMSFLLDLVRSTFKKEKELLALVSLVMKNERKNEEKRKYNFFHIILFNSNCYYVALKVVTFM